MWGEITYPFLNFNATERKHEYQWIDWNQDFLVVSASI